MLKPTEWKRRVPCPDARAEGRWATSLLSHSSEARIAKEDRVVALTALADLSKACVVEYHSAQSFAAYLQGKPGVGIHIVTVHPGTVDNLAASSVEAFEL